MNCAVIHPDRGTRCGLPVGHWGRHQNGTLVGPWEDIKPIEIKSQSENPACTKCGTIMMRRGTCFTCPGCGDSSGCG